MHTLRVDRPHDREATPPSLERFAAPGWALVQCAYCRRFATTPERRWLWVPDWVRDPPALVSHGICEPCAAHYFGGDRGRLSSPR